MIQADSNAMADKGRNLTLERNDVNKICDVFDNIPQSHDNA